MGKSVTTLNTGAFAWRYESYGNHVMRTLSFAKVYFKGMIPPSSAYGAFGVGSYWNMSDWSTERLGYVAVPIGCKDAYMKAFSNYIDVIEEIEF